MLVWVDPWPFLFQEACIHFFSLKRFVRYSANPFLFCSILGEICWPFCCWHISVAEKTFSPGDALSFWAKGVGILGEKWWLWRPALCSSVCLVGCSDGLVLLVGI